MKASGDEGGRKLRLKAKADDLLCCTVILAKSGEAADSEERESDGETSLQW